MVMISLIRGGASQLPRGRGGLGLWALFPSHWIILSVILLINTVQKLPNIYYIYY